MLPPFAVGLRACCVAVALILATADAAEKKPLIGATRVQVLERFGEPKSAIVAGTREVLFFARDRIVLRDGVVVEVEQLPAEQPVRRAPPPPAPEIPVAAPVAPPPAAPAAPQPAPAEVSPPAANPAPAAAPILAPTPEPAAPRVEIKSVRRPDGAYVRPPLRSEVPESASAANTVALPGKPTAPTATAPSVQPPIRDGLVAPAAPAVSPAPSAPVSIPSTQTRTVRRELPPEPVPAAKAGETTSKSDNVKKSKARAARRLLEDASMAEEEPMFATRTYVLAFIVVGGGLALLIWQSRQRRLALAATAVSHTPFTAAAGSSNKLRFNADLLAKLEWKRFEDLVTAYYSKTGVVAARTKAGPTKPVHIKISWKGEPRPFAYVQCIPSAPGLIEAEPVLELVAALTADDIRRGYMVTNGKFGVNARDLAEEKHITLLPGDIFLEKLNALPDAARAELMQEITTGDYTTPSCPKCEAKMVKAGDDPSIWKCAAHPDQIIKTGA